MQPAFKFNTFGIFSFLVLCGLFYWLCPAISQPVWRYLADGVFLAGAFCACFLVIKPK